MDHTFQLSTVPNFDVKCGCLPFGHGILLDCCRLSLSRACAFSVVTGVFWKKKGTLCSETAGTALRSVRQLYLLSKNRSTLHSETKSHVGTYKAEIVSNGCTMPATSKIENILACLKIVGHFKKSNLLETLDDDEMMMWWWTL